MSTSISVWKKSKSEKKRPRNFDSKRFSPELCQIIHPKTLKFLSGFKNGFKSNLNNFFFPPFSIPKKKFTKNINAYFFGHFGKILLLLFSRKFSFGKMWITHYFLYLITYKFYTPFGILMLIFLSKAYQCLSDFHSTTMG